MRSVANSSFCPILSNNTYCKVLGRTETTLSVFVACLLTVGYWTLGYRLTGSKEWTCNMQYAVCNMYDNIPHRGAQGGYESKAEYGIRHGVSSSAAIDDLLLDKHDVWSFEVSNRLVLLELI